MSKRKRYEEQFFRALSGFAAWSLIALLEAGVSLDHPALLKSGRWLISKQITDVKGDWAIKNPEGVAGGWSFEFENDYFPDVDDTIAICTVLYRLKLPIEEKVDSIDLAVKWILSMQSRNGGWGAFDKDNTNEWVNKIPFADHRACLDDPSPDITARALELLCELNLSKTNHAKSAVKYLLHSQERFGGWFARWGVNYIYGTWCAVTALRKYGWALEHPRLERASKWLLSIQNSDGGFGESPSSYDENKYINSPSCPSQTAWALMALTALGFENSKSAKLAVDYLMKTRNSDGLWSEPNFTGTGFPSHFYIRYHGYARYFPILALARWKKAISQA